MKKVLFTAKVVKLHINVFHLPFLRMFKDAGWETSVAARNDFAVSEDCVISGCDKFYDLPFVRNPFSPANLKLYRGLRDLMRTNSFDIVHCHTPIVGILTRLAARKTDARVIYTAHGFHFFKGAPLLNWLVYYPAEKLCSRWTDTLITINREDYEIACKKMHAKHVELVPGVGVDVARFADTVVDFDAKRNELGIAPNDFVILSAGELVENKNQKLIIRALAENECRDMHYLVAGTGCEQEKLEQLACELSVQDRVHFIGYRSDLNELYKIVDVLVHPSYREGLPVVVMEAMASGLPVIASDVRGNRDLLPQERLLGCEDHRRLAALLAKAQSDELDPIPLPEEYSIDSVMERMREIYGV